MNNFIRLIQNENMKIYVRVRTWIMLSILALLSIGVPILLSLENNATKQSVWDSFMMSTSFVFFLNTIFAVVIAAESVAGEFSWGTIKLLLIRPWSRSKILASKYIATLLFSILSTVLLAALSFFTSLLIYSTDTIPSMVPPGIGAGKYVFLSLVCSYVDLFITVAIAFMLSTVFRSGGLSIGLSLFIMFTKGIFTMIFNPEKYTWANYLLFNHMDLSRYLVTNQGPGGATIGFSISILAVYYLILMAVTWVVFKKRDVAA
ncbi:ABC transporter permease [Paenibacillus sediminis]|uniref:ABC transporter permease n=1 Tax=Paenibacillus sediminis TaxID=664909 RepID=UPI001AE827B3|nr:DUF2705 family protein [Paenibacillus sediminis]